MRLFKIFQYALNDISTSQTGTASQEEVNPQVFFAALKARLRFFRQLYLEESQYRNDILNLMIDNTEQMKYFFSWLS